MGHHRFFCRPIKPPVAVLEADQARHLHQVLRLGPDDEVELFDGQGGWTAGKVRISTPRRAEIEVGPMQVEAARTAGRIILVASLAKGDRFDWLVAKATELGVDHLCPTLCARTVKQGRNPRLVDRYEKLAVAAAKQCGRHFLPAIDPPSALAAVLDRLAGTYPAAVRLWGDPDPGAVSLARWRTDWDTTDVIAVVGPEGGLNDEETRLLAQVQATPLRLTNTILRVETAAVAFAAALALQRDDDANRVTASMP